MFAQDVVPVVLCLPRIHDAGLGKISGWSNAAERVIEIDSRDSLVKVAGVGDRIAKAISAELHIQAAITDTRFIHHARREIVGFG